MTDIPSIKARVEAATPGPWGVLESRTLLHVETPLGVEGLTPGLPVCSIPWKRRADADFIAHAREDIPALLAELDRVTRERDEKPMSEGSARYAMERIDRLELAKEAAESRVAQLEAELAEARTSVRTAALEECARIVENQPEAAHSMGYYLASKEIRALRAPTITCKSCGGSNGDWELICHHCGAALTKGDHRGT